MIGLQMRNLLFIALQPGVAVFLVPFLILTGFGYKIVPSVWGPNNFIGAAMIVFGSAIALLVIFRFVDEGKGTISPLDPTKKLVVSGLYRYTRNPMYVAAVTVVFGEAVFWWAVELVVYALLLFLLFNAFVLLHEEPRLRRVFGDEYEQYAKTVRRWI